MYDSFLFLFGLQLTPRIAEPPNPRKKKPLTEIEIALKREETARKRRNLTEKKLEDEKVCMRIQNSR